ncbi:MAG: calcium-binding protein, partial [Rhodobacteraceae bacterium]|nr:calcium-binding protein [Paracoccaceae bacterium]
LNMDRFVFRGNATGHDIITDFEDDHDLILIKAKGVKGFDDLIIDSGDGVFAVITWGTKGSITVEGVTAAQLTEDDFVF